MQRTPYRGHPTGDLLVWSAIWDPKQGTATGDLFI
jgi:hypothetical protein